MSKKSVYILVPVYIEIITCDDNNEKTVSCVEFPTNSEVNDYFTKGECIYESLNDIQEALECFTTEVNALNQLDSNLTKNCFNSN